MGRLCVYLWFHFLVIWESNEVTVELEDSTAWSWTKQFIVIHLICLFMYILSIVYDYYHITDFFSTAYTHFLNFASLFPKLYTQNAKCLTSLEKWSTALKIFSNTLAIMLHRELCVVFCKNWVKDQKIVSGFADLVCFCCLRFSFQKLCDK